MHVANARTFPVYKLELNIPFVAVIKLRVAGGPAPALVEAETLHTYGEYGLRPPTVAVTSEVVREVLTPSSSAQVTM